jgi:hypothetical protein
VNRADNRKALIQLTGATRVVGEALLLSALHKAERPPRGGLAEIRSGCFDQAAVADAFRFLCPARALCELV